MKHKLSSLLGLLLLAFSFLGFNQANATLLTTTIGPVKNVCCNGGTDGWATTNPSGGTTPYTYLWTPAGGTNATGTGLSAGTYTVTVTDYLGNTTTASVTITEPTVLIATPTFPTNNTSCINPNGNVGVIASGGIFPYTYSWMPSGLTNANVSGLAAGTYTCNVTDNICCLSTVSVTIGGTSGPMVTLSTTPDTVSCDGTASASVAWGTAPYTYLWSPGGKTTASITGLCAGTYCCLVTDHSGCRDSNCVTVRTSRQVDSCGCSSNVPTFATQQDLTTMKVDVFPNPANNKLNITITGNLSHVNFYLTNILGRDIFTDKDKTISSTYKETINMEPFQPGIYFLTIESNGQKLVKKVTKL